MAKFHSLVLFGLVLWPHYLFAEITKTIWSLKHYFPGNEVILISEIDSFVRNKPSTLKIQTIQYNSQTEYTRKLSATQSTELRTIWDALMDPRIKFRFTPKPKNTKNNPLCIQTFTWVLTEGNKTRVICNDPEMTAKFNFFNKTIERVVELKP